MGFDHVIANQFLIPLGMMFGEDISVFKLLVEALLPATIGNVIGGGVFVGAIYWYVFDSMNTTKSVMGRLRFKTTANTVQQSVSAQGVSEGLKMRSKSVSR